MIRKKMQAQQARPSRSMHHMTITEFRAMTYLATLALAGIAIIMRVYEPVVWGFLGTAIGITIGQALQKQ